MPSADLLDVVALVMVREQEVLVAQRSAADRLAFKWEFPGGKIEPSETPEFALEREIHEELGLKIEVTAHFLTTEYREPPVPIRLHAYLGQSLSNEVESRVHQQVRWVSISELSRLDFAPADLPVVDKLLDLFGEQNTH